MRLAQTVLTLACLVGLVTGPWASSAVQAQPASLGLTREGTVVSVNREDSSFVMSVKENPPREVTVHAQKFTEISVVGQRARVGGSVASLAVGDHVVVHMLTLANGQVVAVSTHVVSRAPAAGATTGAKQTGTASSTSAAPSRAGSSGSGFSVGVSGDASSTGAGVSVGVNGRGSAGGNGVSVDAGGRGSGGGNGASVDVGGRVEVSTR